MSGCETSSSAAWKHHCVYVYDKLEQETILIIPWKKDDDGVADYPGVPETIHHRLLGRGAFPSLI